MIEQQVGPEPEVAAQTGVTRPQSRWTIRLLEHLERAMSHPKDVEKEAKRSRVTKWSLAGLAVAAIVTTGAFFAHPYVNDYLRENGTLDPTTPIMRPLDTSNRVVGYFNDQKPTIKMAELANPYDSAASGQAGFLNDVPGLTYQVNLDLVSNFTNNVSLFTNLAADQSVHTIVVPYSLGGSARGDSRPITFVQSEEKRILKSKLPTATGTGKVSVFVISADDELDLLNPIFGARLDQPEKLVSLLPMGGGGGPTIEESLSSALSKAWLRKVIDLANQNQSPQRKGGRLDPDSGPSDLINRFGPPIVVTKIDKEKFDERRIRRGKGPHLQRIPSSTSVYTPNTDSCMVVVMGATSERAPAEVQITLGASYASNYQNRYMEAAQMDWENDGIPDTPFDSEHQGMQRHLFNRSGRHTVAAQVRLNDGTVLSCSNSFDLK